MFERNRIEAPDKTALTVELSLDDGRTLTGKLVLPTSRRLDDELNHAGRFLEFEDFQGERSFILKSTVRSVRSRAMPRTDQLKLKLRDGEGGFDPHAVLGIQKTAAWEQVRAAYHQLVRIYHPDRFASADLPLEVKDYLAAMARRINMAYAALEGARLNTQRAAAARPAPRFHSTAQG